MMEAASVPTEGQQEQTQVTPPATEQPAATTGDAASTQQTPSAPDLAEQVADALQRRQNESQEQQAPTGNLLDALKGEPAAASDDQLTAEDIAVLQQFGLDPNALTAEQAAAAGQQQQQQPAADPRVDEILQRVERMDEANINRELNAIETEFPDVRDPQVFAGITEKLEPLVQEYGEQVKTNPVLIRTLYKATKAELADAASTPAEQAGADAASLETSAGRSQQGDSDLSEQLADTLIGARGSGTAFTR
jgi:2-hydroxychromene-2-carboxylate isomerase